MTVVMHEAETVQEELSWVDPSGTEHNLTQLGYTIVTALSGRWAPALSFSEDRIPYRPGARNRLTLVDPRVVAFAVAVGGSTLVQRFDRLRDLVDWFDGTRGLGRLRVKSPAGDWRELYGRGRVTIDESNQNGPLWQPAAVEIRAADDPYWYDLADQSAQYSVPITGGTWFPLAFPIVLGSSSVFTTAYVLNDATADAWPVWTITGPGSTPALRNLTTGKSLVMNRTLLAGQQIVVDTRDEPLTTSPKSITDGLGTNLFSTRMPGGELWPLARGSNLIQVGMDGATSASSISLSYRRRWSSP